MAEKEHPQQPTHGAYSVIPHKRKVHYAVSIIRDHSLRPRPSRIIFGRAVR
jgi:hypothetical protein